MHTIVSTSSEIKIKFNNNILVEVNELGFLFKNIEFWDVKDRMIFFIN